jgi:hypothetical protein
MVELGWSLTPGGVMTVSGATAGCRPATGKTQRAGGRSYLRLCLDMRYISFGLSNERYLNVSNEKYD